MPRLQHLRPTYPHRPLRAIHGDTIRYTPFAQHPANLSPRPLFAFSRNFPKLPTFQNVVLPSPDNLQLATINYSEKTNPNKPTAIPRNQHHYRHLRFAPFSRFDETNPPCHKKMPPPSTVWLLPTDYCVVSLQRCRVRAAAAKTPQCHQNRPSAAVRTFAPIWRISVARKRRFPALSQRARERRALTPALG
jgi:hypothetical protein